MIKEFLTDTLEFDKFLKADQLLLENDSTIDFDRKKESNKLLKKLNVNYKKRKKESDFSSLERIRIVVDSLIDDLPSTEIAKRENISEALYLKWKHDFHDAFSRYSEDVLIKQNIADKNKELILSETNNESVYNFFKQYVNVGTGKNLVIPKSEKLGSYSNFYRTENLFVLKKMNDFRKINKHLEEVNGKLKNGGILVGCFETFTNRANRRKVNKVPFLSSAYNTGDFIVNRVIPKLPYAKKVYFQITKGKNRLLSKAECLGRLICCGFEILDYKVIDGIHYFAARKVKEPAFDMNPSYGPLFKMRRVGKNGKIIGVYKFRTMHPYSEYLQEYLIKTNGYSNTGKIANDFRIVPWAKTLRKYWLDELPQLINVAKGELKLVGIRPVSKAYFENSIPKDIQELRLTQKPGCIPPYVALDRQGAVDSVLQAEREYLQAKLKNPYTTDTKFFFKAIYNIVFKRKRSA